MKWVPLDRLMKINKNLVNAIVQTLNPISLSVTKTSSDYGNNPIRIPIITTSSDKKVLIESGAIGVLINVQCGHNTFSQVDFYGSFDINTIIQKSYIEMMRFVKSHHEKQSLLIPGEQLSSFQVLTW